MKTLHTNFLKLFVLLCLGLSSNVQGDEKGIADHTKIDKSMPLYTRTLTSIISEEDSNVGNCINLSDGSAWTVKGYYHGGNRDLKTWAKGDRIVLMWNSKGDAGYYIVYNLERSGQPKVLLDPKSVKIYPYITEVSDGGYYVKMSDNTVWKITWWGRKSTMKWEVGQHVIIQGDGYVNNYSMTNLDISGETFNNYKHAYATFMETQK